MAQTTETLPPDRRQGPAESADKVLDDIYRLPFDAQLGVVRTVVPKLIARLQGEQREGFIRDLNEEIKKAERGEPSYDARTNISTM